MNRLSKNIINKFYSFLVGEMTTLQFENWIYDSTELENELDEINYYDFISFGFKKSGATHDLEHLIRKHINIAEFETWKLKKTLYNVLEKKNNYYDSILEFYDLYRKGYNFLDNLGIGYGLALDCPYSEYGVNTYEQLSQEQKDEIVNSFYPQIEFEIKKVLKWLDSDLIVLHSDYDNYGNIGITDNRFETDKEPTAYKIAVDS